MIGKEAGEHATHGHNAHSHDHHGGSVFATNITQDQKTNSRYDGADAGGGFTGNGGVDFF